MRSSACWPSPASVTRAPVASSNSRATVWLTVLSSTTSTRTSRNNGPQRSSRAPKSDSLGLAAGMFPFGSRSRHQKVLPTPARLSTPT